MDRESFRQQRRTLCGHIELSRQQAGVWIDQAASPSIPTAVKVGLKLFMRYGLSTFLLKNPFFLSRLLFK